MRWDYNVEPILETDPSMPYGIKITKSYYDDSDTLIVKIDTTAEDAYENAGPDFVQEFFDAAKSIFSNQIQTMLTYTPENGITSPGAGRGSYFGSRLQNALAQGLTLINGPID